MLDADGLGVHCQDAACPYKEEQYRISLTVYIHSYALLEAYTKSFYLREIGTLCSIISSIILLLLLYKLGLHNGKFIVIPKSSCAIR